MRTVLTRLGVLGWPVAHSRSPAIQNAALAAVGLGESWRYQLLPVPPELFDATVPALPELGFRGVNVTIPHKHAALALATVASARARAIGAANTLIFAADGQIQADNTDAPALVAALTRALREHRPARPPDSVPTSSPLAGTTALVLGAGGTARAAVWALTDAGAEVSVWNRTTTRAHELCAEVGGAATEEVADLGTIDVLINCTSVGLGPADSIADLPQATADLIATARVVVEFVYTDHDTPISRAARAAGVPVVTGLELLVGQGALSFELFTGLDAPVAVMRGAVGLSSAP
jgi:shikimate dehydrogenase